MAWRVDEVDEKARSILALLDEVQVILRELIEEGDGPGEGDRDQAGRGSALHSSVYCGAGTTPAIGHLLAPLPRCWMETPSKGAPSDG